MGRYGKNSGLKKCFTGSYMRTFWLALWVLPWSLLGSIQIGASQIVVEAMHIPLQQVFIRLAAAADVDLVMQGHLQDPVHVRWQGLPARQALRMLCQTIEVHCYWWQGGNLQPDPDVSQAQASPKASGLLVTDQVVERVVDDWQLLTVVLQYAQVAQVAGQLRQHEALLAGGQMLVDERRHSLSLRVPAAQIEPLRALVKSLDQPLQQLHIAARVVIANSDVGASLRQGLETQLSNQSATQTHVKQLSLNSENGLGSLQMGLVARHILLNLELAAMEASGQVLTLAQPQIVVQEGHQGVIETGQEVPYLLEQDGHQSRQWKQAVLGLNVTPRVLPNNKVELDLSVVQDSVGDLLANGELVLNTHRLRTRVNLGLGQTLVLGGALYEQQLTRLLSNPAWLSLPFIGHWMQDSRQQLQRFELLVLVTPTLVNP